MDKINDGGPAFPRDHQHQGHNGMTLRDYFAAQALQGIESSQGNSGFFISTPEDIAARAYHLADAMLRARDGTA